MLSSIKILSGALKQKTAEINAPFSMPVRRKDAKKAEGPAIPSRRTSAFGLSYGQARLEQKA